MSKLIGEIQQIVAQRMRGQRAGHGLDHVLRVLQNARMIQAEVGGNALIVEAAALLHDIGDAKFHDGVERSGQISRQILGDLGEQPALIEAIVQIVDNISFRHGNKAAPLTLEGQIVQDADRLDALGAIGIVRTIEYGAALGQPFFLPGADVANSPTGVGHFYQKLFKLRMQLNTEPAKRIAIRREQFMHQFLDRFFDECGVEVERAT